MNLLAGLLDQDRRTSPDGRLLRAMAARVHGTPAPAQWTGGALGFLVAGEGARLETGDPLILAADLDLLDPGDVRDLLAAWSREGARSLERLRGAFALAVWDPREEELVLAVDRFGIKRLYYAATDRGLAFATRPAALRAAPGVDAAVAPAAVYHYLNLGYVPAPHSILAGVRRLPPGHILRCRVGEHALERYWDLVYPERPWALREAAAATFSAVESAVARCLRGTPAKETGAFLSGGTDSSTVVGLIGRVTGERVSAFSIGFREPRYNELHYAELAARHFNASHYTAIVGADEALDALPRLVDAYDEPFGNSSMIPTYFCARQAREAGMRLLLAGDGGDEIFGGNERYRWNHVFAVYAAVPRWLRRGVIEPLLARLPDGGDSPLGKAQRYVRRARIPNPRRFYSYAFLVASKAQALLTPEFLASVDPEAPWTLIEEHFDRARAASELNRLLYLDLKLTIGDNDLYKVTRTAELAGIGVRFPMLDHELAEFTGTLPARFKVKRLEKRYLFKRAFQGLLPPEILAKTKHGFGLPIDDWLRHHQGWRELARDALLASDARIRTYLMPEAIPELFRLQEEDTTPYYGDILWTCLMLELWHRRHAGEATGP
jgi:asparagine synthase (glutamine-hydrolysing)